MSHDSEPAVNAYEKCLSDPDYFLKYFPEAGAYSGEIGKIKVLGNVESDIVNEFYEKEHDDQLEMLMSHLIEGSVPYIADLPNYCEGDIYCTSLSYEYDEEVIEVKNHLGSEIDSSRQTYSYVFFNNPRNFSNLKDAGVYVYKCIGDTKEAIKEGLRTVESCFGKIRNIEMLSRSLDRGISYIH